jgi:WD40 repeat protein
MSIWPLQVYSSGIVLSPQTSIVRVANLDNIPRWLKALPQVEATWASLVQTFRGYSGGVTAVAFSPDGKHIASGSWDKTVKLWDATTGDVKKTLKGHLYWVTAVAFSPDGKYIASGSWDKTVKLWDATTGDVKKTLKGHLYWVTAVAFSPDGKYIASGSWDKTVKLWDATTGDVKKTLKGHLYWVTAVAFSPDGKHIASGSWDKTVKLWDVAKALRPSRYLGKSINSHLKYRSKREIKTLHAVTYLKYSGDGRKIVSNVGSLTVDDVALDLHDRRSTSLEHLRISDMWLCYGAMRLLQLASDSEPQCYDTDGDQIAVGMSSGLVLVFDIDRRRLDEALRNSVHDI